MRIIDWSSDVCSSDLRQLAAHDRSGEMGPEPAVAGGAGAWRSALFAPDKQQFLARYRPVDGDAAARRGEGAVLPRVRRELMHEKRDIGDDGALDRAAERGVGNECVGEGGYRWA